MIEKGRVMTKEEEDAARRENKGIPELQYVDETIETSHGPIHFEKLVPESDEGTYDPETKKFIPFHRGEQERKAA